MGILQFESVNCKDCCKCIGVCPVKAIEVKNHRAMIVERDCILCGNCTIACPQHTKHGADESASVKELIRSGRKVIWNALSPLPTRRILTAAALKRCAPR